MTQTQNLINRLPVEFGGLDAGPLVRVEHELEPWEKRCHALPMCLISIRSLTPRKSAGG